MSAQAVFTKYAKYFPVKTAPSTVIGVFPAPDNPTNHLLLEVELHMRSSNKRELNVYGPPPIDLE
ncbi:hypothetical protein L208DRAFT_1408178 [Tricholoma matsutake]|nr:hypothetical protein L208DRAFT_1408178 [Tricholoma matsutake 945]